MLTIDNVAEHRSPLTDGARAMLPAVVAYVPFGLLVGAHVATSPQPLVAWLGTFTIYGGAAQLALLDVLAAGGSVVAAAVTALLLQARLAVYAAALAPDWRAAPLRARLLAAVTLTDVPWAMSQGRAAQTGDVASRRRFYLGAALTLWAAWPVFVTAGMLGGTVLARQPVAGLVAPLLFGALVAPHLRERRGAVTALAAAVTATVTAPWSTGSAVLLSAAVGAVVAALADRSRR
jgi:predicted branched-subunit amino acid permease